MRWLANIFHGNVGRTPYRRPDDFPHAPRYRLLTALTLLFAIAASIVMLVTAAFPVKTGSWRLTFQASSGRAVLWWAPSPTPPPGPTRYELSTDWPPIGWPRITYAGEVVSPGTPWTTSLWYASVPLWLVAAGSWFALATLIVLKRPWGYCRKCGYNLRFISPLRPCPECGGVHTRS